MMDLESLKARLLEKQAQKNMQVQADEAIKYDHNCKAGDILVILHDYEVEVLEKILLDALEYWDDDVLTNIQKRTILNVLHLLQGLTR